MKVITAGRLSCWPANWAIVCPLRLQVVFGTFRSAPGSLGARPRVNAKWNVLDARYENLVLQFFGETALLTYRNIVKETDEKGVPTTWLYTWADVWVKEDGEWKVAAIYVIDSEKA